MSHGDNGLSRLERLLSMVTRLRPGEGRTALLFFLHGFLLLASFQVMKALREAFILTKFSAETRSYVVALVAVALMLVVPLYGWLRRHLDGVRLLRMVTIIFVIGTPLFALLAELKVPIAIPFYIWVGVYGVMVVSQMWAFASDSFNVKSGQRLFVLIALGANLGALAGAKITQMAAEALSPLGLLVFSTITLAATLFLANPERAAVPPGSRAAEVAHARIPHLLGGIALVLRDRYLLLIALFIVLLNWINSTGEFILADYMKAHALTLVEAGEGGGNINVVLAELYGNFNFWVTLIGLAIQLLLVARIYRTVGIRGALLVHPILLAIGYGVLALAPMLGGFIPIFSLIRRIKVADNGVDYSLMNTTRQTLFLPVDRESKYEGKLAIDTFFWRFGDMLQAAAVYVGLNLFGWSTHDFARQNFVLSLIFIAVANVIGRQYSRKVQASVTNTAPEAVEPIPDLHCLPGKPFTHAMPANAFVDHDPGDVLVFRACCHDGRPLPRWLRFDPWRQTFAGVAPHHVEITELHITVIASDLEGLRARSTFVLRHVTEVL